MLLYKLRLALASLFYQARVSTVLLAVLMYAASCYLLLYAAGEQDILKPTTFFYYLVVTASTVGYGDYSPTTNAGKWVTSLWVIPLGLSLFAVALTRAGMYLSELILKGKKGLRMLRHQGHIVIIGWNQARTHRLIELLMAKTNGTNAQLVLCVDSDIENPMPGDVDFVRVESFSHAETMARASLETASRIIIDTPQDDVTLTTALFCNKISPNSHKTAYFEDESMGTLLKDHCPNIECIPSISTELLAKASLDPGSSQLHRQLLDSTEGMTQYSVRYDGAEELSYGKLFDHLKHNLTATIIGLRKGNEANLLINPDMSEIVRAGDTLYYINEKRVDEHACFDLNKVASHV